MPSRRDVLAGTVGLSAAGPAAATTSTPDRSWSRTYAGDGTARTLDAVVPAGDGYLLGGTVDYDHPRGWLAGVDAAGRLRWQQRFGPVGSSLSAGAPAPDGAVFVGTTNGDATAGRTDPERGTPWLVRVTADGGVRWAETYGATAATGSGEAVARTAAGYVLAGALGGDGDRRPWVAAVDDWGTVRWRWEPSPGDRQVSASAVAATDVGVYVAASERPPDADPADGYTEDAWVARLDGEGGSRWRRRFATVGSGDRVEALVGRPGGVAALGRRSFGPGEGAGWFAGLDADGAVAWEQRYPRDFWNWLDDACRAGRGYALVGTRELSGDDRRGWLLRVGPRGGVRSERTLGDGYADGHAVVPGVDGGLVVGGDADADGGQAGWLAQVGGPEPDRTLTLPRVPSWVAPFAGGVAVGAGALAAAARLRDRG